MRPGAASAIRSAEATLIVLNDGLVLTGRSANFAFNSVKQHPALIDAVVNGAKVVLMPKLACMSQVTDRGLTFAEAMDGVNKPGISPLSFFDQERVATWWESDVPLFFEAIPSLWLPAMPGIAGSHKGGNASKNSGTSLSHHVATRSWSKKDSGEMPGFAPVASTQAEHAQAKSSKKRSGTDG